MSLLAKAEGGAQYSGGGLQGGEAVSAFRAVGSQLAVSSPAVRPATSPLARSPDPARRHLNQVSPASFRSGPQQTDHIWL